MSTPQQHLETHDNVCLGCVDNCVVSVWAGWGDPPRPEQVHRLAELIEQCGQRTGERVALLVILENGAPVLGDAQRASLEAFYAGLASRFGAVAQVVEGGNLWASTARNMLTAMRLADARPYPLRVFDELGEAVQWLIPHVRPEPSTDSDRDRLRGFFDAVRKGSSQGG